MSVFIVAEVGINHNGSLEIAKDLIDSAIKAGCNAVKFQKRDIYKVYSKAFLDKPRESPWGTKQLDQKLGLEFNEDDYINIDEYCKRKGIEWFASAWDVNSQIFLQKFKLNYNKIASALILDTSLLKTVAAEKKHTFISTGMSNIEDIKIAVNIFKEFKCPFELMHTVSTYPMRDEDANLKVINTLRNEFACDVGYSGHEVGLSVSYAATALGISSLERHITLDRAMYGSDQSASLEPRVLEQLVGGVRKIESAMGDGVKRIIQDEVPIARKLREHLNLESNY